MMISSWPRPYVAQIEMAIEEEENEQQARLAKQVREATFAQLETLIWADVEKIRHQKPEKNMEAVETALDLKYIRERQKHAGCTRD